MYIVDDYLDGSITIYQEKENMEIGKKLKEARLNRDLTQEVIAEKLNVSRQTISNWENEVSQTKRY